MSEQYNIDNLSPFEILLAYQNWHSKRLEVTTQLQQKSNNYLAFKAGDNHYLISMDFVLEVAIEINDITPLPFSPSWLLGLTSRRTDIYSVIDFYAFVEKKPRSSTRNASYILLQGIGQGYILKVEAVFGIRVCDVAFFQGQQKWINGMTQMDEKSWLRINLANLVADASFIQSIQ